MFFAYFSEIPGAAGTDTSLGVQQQKSCRYLLVQPLPVSISCFVFPREDNPLNRTFRSTELPALLSLSLGNIRGFGATSPTGPRNFIPLFSHPAFRIFIFFLSFPFYSLVTVTTLLRFCIGMQHLSISFQMYMLRALRYTHSVILKYTVMFFSVFHVRH